MAVISGGEKLEAYLKKLSKRAAVSATVRVGFEAGATYPDGTSVPMVAAIQEFGAPAKGIPPRPFMRPTVAAHSKQWGEVAAENLKVTGGDTVASLGRLGSLIEGQIVAAIKSVTSPPLSPVTLLLRQRFGNSPEEVTFADVQKAREDVASGEAAKVTPTQRKPLVWTGKLQNSVTSQVTAEGQD